MNTDPRKGVFLLLDHEDRLGDPRFARPGSTSRRSPEPLPPSRPLSGQRSLSHGPQMQTTSNQVASDLSAPRCAHLKATPRSGAAKWPALTRPARRAHASVSAPESMSILSHQKACPEGCSRVLPRHRRELGVQHSVGELFPLAAVADRLFCRYVSLGSIA
jgi:hypothetical protein